MSGKYNYILLLLLIITGSCNKFLDVQPEDKYTEDQVFRSELNVQQALNGLYVNMAANSLYGAYLSNTVIEVMARRYNVPATINGQIYSDVLLTYASPAAQGTYFDVLWSNAYATIRKTNLFIADLQQAESFLSHDKINLLKGEALAIRAMLHFDLLRLYGPVFANGDSVKMSIPYLSSTDTKLSSLLPANQVMDSVMADLNMAAGLLVKDTIRTAGVMMPSNIDFYSSYRNRRLNYYAVKGLIVRALLYRGNKTAAHDAAKALLDESEQWFGWLPYANILNAGTNPDRVFSTEILFGLYNPDMYTVYQSNFVSTLNSFTMLTAQKDRLNLVFENNQNDYRFITTWLVGPNNIRTFNKFADIDDATKTWRFVQPLLRKTELYYTLAETDPDPATGLQYLNTVRHNRGLPDLAAGADLKTEIQKEYQKEFWGEGQLFFYFKRNNLSAIPSGTDGNAGSVVNNPVYVVPLPSSETQLRNQ